jgi:hypothetical protein
MSAFPTSFRIDDLQPGKVPKMHFTFHCETDEDARATMRFYREKGVHVEHAEYTPGDKTLKLVLS